MGHYVRITAMPTVDNQDEFPIYIDVILDEDALVRSDRPYFGFQGEIEQRLGASMPFVVHSDGRMDFGEKYPSPDRFYQIDLPGRRIKLDQLLTIDNGSDYKVLFRISDLASLA